MGLAAPRTKPEWIGVSSPSVAVLVKSPSLTLGFFYELAVPDEYLAYHEHIFQIFAYSFLLQILPSRSLIDGVVNLLSIKIRMFLQII